MKKHITAAVILCGCGHLDGSEIREATIALLELDSHNVKVKCFASDKQFPTMDHKNKIAIKETRNALIESARIARGEIESLENLDSKDFDMVIIPGGFGVAKNLSNLAESKEEVTVLSEFKKVILDFFKEKKPIGAICIAPAVIVAVLGKITKPSVTVGEDKDEIINKLGGKHVKCNSDSSVYDSKNNIFSCSAYMRNDSFYRISLGIKHMINSMVENISSKAS